MGMELRKFVAPELITGQGARLLAGNYCAKLGLGHVLLVSDPGVIAAGWLDGVREAIEEEGLACTVYDRVSPNPREHEVRAGYELYRENACDGIVVIGGGSPIDCAKGIGIVAANGGDILDFEGVDTIRIPVPPLVCIPTTAGTSADVSQFAIILDSKEKNKIAIISKAIVPDVSLIDPEPTLSMDPFLSACTGVDAITHAVEAFCSNASSPITDSHALHAVELLYQNIRRVIADPGDLEARYLMTLGSLEAGLAFSNASLGAVHAMAHSLGGLLDLPHGECNAILLSHVMEFNYPDARERFIRLAPLLGLDPRGMNDGELRKKIAAQLLNLRRELGIAANLKELGVRSADIPELAAKAVKDACLVTNPRKARKGDLETIYAEAM